MPQEGTRMEIGYATIHIHDGLVVDEELIERARRLAASAARAQDATLTDAAPAVVSAPKPGAGQAPIPSMSRALRFEMTR